MTPRPPTRPLLFLLVAALALVQAPLMASASSGTTLTVDLNQDVDSVDPAIAYSASSWEVEYATSLRLMNYVTTGGAAPVLSPEAAAGMPRISPDGKIYDFTVDAGATRFSNGAAVSASSFKEAFDRVADPKVSSPGRSFMRDIVGAGRSPVSGVEVSGDHLIIHLIDRAPDFLARVAMPFFSATPVGLPRAPAGANAPASAGPYFVSSRVPKRSLDLSVNPFYKGPRSHAIPHIHYNVGISPELSYRRVVDSVSDYAASGLGISTYAEAHKRYGVNKSQYWVMPLDAISFFAFNHNRSLFRGASGTALAKAINFAIDRRAMVNLAGVDAAVPSTQIIPPALGAPQRPNSYPKEQANLAEARRWLARAHLPRGTRVEFYTSNGASALMVADLFRKNLARIGVSVRVHSVSRVSQIKMEDDPKGNWDVSSEGWLADFADPYDFVNVLLDPAETSQVNGNDIFHYNAPRFTARMRAVAALPPSERLTAYAELDRAIMDANPPFAARSNPNLRVFVSARVGCVHVNPLYGLDLAALCFR